MEHVGVLKDSQTILEDERELYSKGARQMSAYEFHDQIPRLKKFWKRCPNCRGVPFDYATAQLTSAVLSGLSNVGDLVEEVYVNQDFNASPKYLFVDRKLSAFLDAMHVNGVPSDYVKNTCEKLQGGFVLVWGDGSTNLCDISFVAREKKRRKDVTSMLEKVSGIHVEWNDLGITEGFRIYCAIDSTAPKDMLNLYGVRQTATIIKKIRDTDIEPMTKKDYDYKIRKMETAAGYDALNDEEEGLVGLATTRLIKLLVYIASYPENLRDGIVGDCALAGLQPKHIGRSSHTMTIKAEHRDVSSHIRRQFFRLYPMRKNGERKPGLVFVKSTIVKGTAETAVNNE